MIKIDCTGMTAMEMATCIVNSVEKHFANKKDVNVTFSTDWDVQNSTFKQYCILTQRLVIRTAIKC